jgi:hypothetical protein
MKTSYYQSKKLDPKKHLVVQTSVGNTRWGTQPEWESELIAPPESILGMAQTPYTRAYIAHLEKIGVEALRAELKELNEAAGKREAVLCCFEALKKPGQFCHRRIFAWWWHTETGETIQEL